MNSVVSWLLEGPPWVRYRVLSDLLDKSENDPLVDRTKTDMLADPHVNQLMTDLQGWESQVLKRHNDAVHPIHKLSFLAELGLKRCDNGIGEVAESILKHIACEGPIAVLSNYPTSFGGSGKNEWLWALCDAPTLTYSLMKIGYQDDIKVVKSFHHLISLIRDNGWPCTVADEMRNFRGPGKKSDPCPYANLIMLKAYSADLHNLEGNGINTGIETLLSLWNNSRDQRPYLFKMGTDFRKLKVPFIWYDILHVSDVLSNFAQARSDGRFLEMVEILEQNSDEEGKYLSESIWTKWKGWEFCQKREPSRWVTFCVLRILKRCGRFKAQ